MIKKNHILFAAKAAVSVGLVYFVMANVGAGDAIGRMADAKAGWLALAGLLGVGQVVICAFRWQAVLRIYDDPLGYGRAFRFFYMGAFFNQGLPSTVGGDGIRAYKAYKSGMQLGHALGGVFIDRIATVLALVVLVAVMVALVAGDMGGNAGSDIRTLELATLLLLAAGIGGTVFLMLLDRAPAGISHLRAVRALAAFAGDVRRVFLAPGTALRLLGWALAGHINLSLMVWAIATGVGVETSLSEIITLFPLVLLIQTLPISIAGWGLREGAMVEIFAIAGMAATDAVAVSILFGLVVAVTSLPGGYLWLVSRHHDMNEAEKMAELGGAGSK